MGGRLAKDKWKMDKIKTKYLESLDFKVLRFWEYDIKYNIDKIQLIIKNIIQ